MAVLWKRLSEFCNDFGNIASCLGIVIATVGFVITLARVAAIGRIARNAEKEIRRESESVRIESRRMMQRIGLHVVSRSLDDLLRLLKEIREASHRGEWLRAIDKCQESRQILFQLILHPHLTAHEKDMLKSTPPNLKIVLQYIEKYKLNRPAAPFGLSSSNAESSDQIIDQLGRIVGRISKLAWEKTDVD